MIINDERIQINCFTRDTQLSTCSVEYIYFARPGSNIAEINVRTAWKNIRRDLAKELPVKTNMVVGTPNSPLSTASGYAEASGIPYEIGLVKNQCIARTLIQPTSELGGQEVRMKLSAVREVVGREKVIMVDDSIIRGTTSRRIVHLLKEAGTEGVHVRIASPPLRYPCFYGVDIQTRKELIATSHTIDEIKECIGANSLGFLNEEGLIESAGLERDTPYSELYTTYFNGDYPAPLYDYEEKYQKSLKEKVSFF